MNHSFDVDIAVKYGVPEAILIENFRFWIAKNKANGRHFHKGRYWTYNSSKAMTELFPYWSQDQIKRTLKRLEDAGILLSDNFNASPYDRTKWYALSDTIDCAKSPNEKDEIAQSTKQTDINTDVNHIAIDEQAQAPAKNSEKPQPSAPVSPTSPEPAPAENKPVKAKARAALPEGFAPDDTAFNLASELGICLPIELANFEDYHRAKGSVMADWQAALRTWIRNARKFADKSAPTNTRAAGGVNRQEALEQRNRAVAKEWAENMKARVARGEAV